MTPTMRQRLAAVRGLARQGMLTVEFLRSSGLAKALKAPALARHVMAIAGKRKNPSTVLSLHARNTPDKLALVDATSGRRLTYRELDENVNRLASAMAARGVRRGSRVALMMRNCAEFVEVQWATTRLGAIAVQVGYRLKPAEVAYIVDNSEPAIFFAQQGEAIIAREALAGLARELPLIVVGENYDEVLRGGDPAGVPDDKGNADEAGGVMIYTSGTTGKPKGAARSFKKAMHVSVTDLLRQMKIHHADVHLCVCPLYHSAAPAFVAFVFGVGGTIVLLEHFEPDAILELIERERVTSAFMVPTMLGRLAAAQDGQRRDVASLRWLASGAAPLPTETARRIEAAFGPVLFNFYGATETGLVTLALPGEHTTHPGTIGRALAGNEIRLLDEVGREVEAGQVGELYVRNSMLVSGYHRNRDATEKAMRDGFFSVGDLARVDAEGFFYLADRKHDMVISGGVNIYPLEIEQRLHEHPAVLEAAVIGVPDAEWGESLRAFVVKRPGKDVTADELRAFCKLTLANFKCPKQFEFIDALPRNPTGKVLKRELRARL